MSAEKVNRFLEVSLLLSVMQSDKEFDADTNSCRTCGSQLTPSGIIPHAPSCKWFNWNDLFSERDNLRAEIGFNPLGGE